MNLKKILIEQIEKNDLTLLMHSFGGADGRGKALKFNNYSLIKKLANNIKFKTPKVLYRGIAIKERFNPWDDVAREYVRIQVENWEENKLLSLAGGLRSWSKNKSFAKYYTWTDHQDPIRFLFIWINPKAILSGDLLNRKANELNIPEPLDDREFVCDLKPSENKIIKIEINWDKRVPLYIVTIESR